MPGLVALLAWGLVAVGVGYPLLTGTSSITAWIPAMLGGAILALRLLCCTGMGGGRFELLGTALIAGVGLVACFVLLVKGGFDLSAASQQAQALTAALCVAILVAVFARG